MSSSTAVSGAVDAGEASSFARSRRMAFRRRRAHPWRRWTASLTRLLRSDRDILPPLAVGTVFEKPVVVSTYLRGRGDPQRGECITADDYQYLKPWYESVCSCGVTAIVIHDCLTNAFVNSLTTPDIHFVKAPQQTLYSTNDYRFFLYFQLCRNLRAPAIYATDISDVTLTTLPLPTSTSELVVGNTGQTYRQAGWFRGITDLASQPAYDALFDSLPDRAVVNAGVFGGSPKTFRTLVASIAMELLSIRRPELNLNMPVFNFVCYRDFAEHLNLSLVSQFKKYEKSRTDVCFIHK